MKFVAPEQAPEQAEIIRNTPFWPDVNLSEFRSVMRTDGTVTQPRLKQVGRSDDWCADAGYQLVLQTQSLPASARRADLAGGL